jgi:glutamine amidotransferase
VVVIVDYGMGNLGSIRNMLKRIGAESVVSSSPRDMEKADRLILPGVGAFDRGMERLNALGLTPLLTRRVVGDGVPLLGICLGMHLMAGGSEEGKLAGLGWIDGDVIKFQFDGTQPALKVPHMGWNEVIARRDDPILQGYVETPRFYFVHSYRLVCDHGDQQVGSTWYGYDFCSIVRNRNMVGVQFHPEKSHKFGMTLLKNFLNGA